MSQKWSEYPEKTAAEVAASNGYVMGLRPVTEGNDPSVKENVKIPISTIGGNNGTFIAPIPRDAQPDSGISSPSFSIPSGPADQLRWTLSALEAPVDMEVAAGDEFELVFNYSPSLDGNAWHNLALAKVKEMVLDGTGSTTKYNKYEILTEPLSKRSFSNVTNNFAGEKGSAPLIFTFKKDARFNAGEYIYLVDAVKGSDIDSESGSFMFATSAWACSSHYDPICYQYPVVCGHSLDDGTLVDEYDGIIGETFTVTHQQAGSTNIYSVAPPQTSSGYYIVPTIYRLVKVVSEEE